MTTSRRLMVVSYHYVRDLCATRFPRIRALAAANFRLHLGFLKTHYEMATLDSALDFLNGRYLPRRDLALLTFDDGLKDHFTNVAPILDQHGASAVVFVITGCLEERRVPSAHKSHFLAAELGAERYRKLFFQRLADDAQAVISPGETEAAHFYRFDEPQVARFKYLLNFGRPRAPVQRVIDELFAQYIGEEAVFASELFLNWDEVCQLQQIGISIGGHTHNHVGFANHDAHSLTTELTISANLLKRRLRPQRRMAFAYPFGQVFDAAAIGHLRSLGFDCAFTEERGHNGVRQPHFLLRRFDANDLAARIASRW